MFKTNILTSTFLHQDALINYASKNDIDLTSKRIAIISGCSHTFGENISEHFIESFDLVKKYNDRSSKNTERYNEYVETPKFFRLVNDTIMKTYGFLWLDHLETQFDFLLFIAHSGADQHLITSKTIDACIDLRDIGANITVLTGLTGTYRTSTRINGNRRSFTIKMLFQKFEAYSSDYPGAIEFMKHARDQELQTYSERFETDVLSLFFFLVNEGIDFYMVPTIPKDQTYDYAVDNMSDFMRSRKFQMNNGHRRFQCPLRFLQLSKNTP